MTLQLNKDLCSKYMKWLVIPIRMTSTPGLRTPTYQTVNGHETNVTCQFYPMVFLNPAVLQNTVQLCQATSGCSKSHRMVRTHELHSEGEDHKVESLPLNATASQQKPSSPIVGNRPPELMVLRISHAPLPNDHSIVKARAVTEPHASLNRIRLNGLPQIIQLLEERNPSSFCYGYELPNIILRARSRDVLQKLLLSALDYGTCMGFWDKQHEDAMLLEDVNELTQLWHFKTKSAWPVHIVLMSQRIYERPGANFRHFHI
ncbi:hypothetical protein EDB19DRAFT_1827874 [Suillus lakei]|nr:hypothetical protein EDB19DRAFT_1827874 [Suillus lakei]